MLTGNKGEWSEVYVLLKLLYDRKLDAGDGQLNKLQDLIFPIIKILRDESNGTFEFSYLDDLVLISNGEEVYRRSITEFGEKAHQLLQKLKEKTDTTFSFPPVEHFLESFNIKSLKAKSSVKTDIRIVVHDSRIGTNPELGFSIKSQLGSPSTLLNAGKTTNFIYQIKNIDFSQEQLYEINDIQGNSKIQTRLKKILDEGGFLSFNDLENKTFKNNLLLIDSSLPIILADSLSLFYTTNVTRVSDITEELTTLNPLNFNLEDNHPFYSYKIKRLLSDIALGMMPSKVWNGQLDATGGYLIVKEDGEILCYHIYNRNQFEDYLYFNTRYETASSTRHDFGTIYKDNDAFYFKLNLQIRFI